MDLILTIDRICVEQNLPNLKPLINNDITSKGYVVTVYEWWFSDRKLTIYSSKEEGNDYIKVWGSNIWDDMEDGIIESEKDLENLWKWLTVDRQTESKV